MGKKYYCSLSQADDKLCKHGGNKRYNYGFASGTAGYCRLEKKWTSDLEKCPLLLIDVEEVEG